MDEENEKEVKEREWRERQEERRKVDEEKLGKNQAKRAKAKARKEKAKVLGGVEGMEIEGEGKGGVKKKLGAAKVSLRNGGDDGGEGEGMANGNGVVADEGGGITFHDDD